ncbi:hypothetical protein R1flu_014387 [Riccia fluitans]|uniref:Uncharacterized protein n=1 Tax=Riccia fluitans TaxID=41844 RepID=A0ABD1YFZ5_9MARC
MELLAFRRKGSNKHIKGYKRASQQLKFEIHALNNRERERATELASLHDMESTSRALNEEEREIESAFLAAYGVKFLQHMWEVLKGVTQGHISQTFQVRQV